MARATFVKAARKDIPNSDVKKGDSYYWWSFRFGGKHVSKTPPRRSQLTQSSFKSALYDIEDLIAAFEPNDGLEDDAQGAAQELRDLASECSDSLDNMPDGLKEGSTGQLLQERVDACEAAADELEAIDFDIANKGDGETEEDFWQGKLDEVQGIYVDAP